MENHPIPQDVTGFKFRLIGSVTVKQFLYLLGGGAIALVFYILPMPFLAKIPFMLLSGGVGMALAFIPIDGRPMDKMIYNFAKAIPSENQFIYRKKGAEMLFFSFLPSNNLQAKVVAAQDNPTNNKALLFNQFSKTHFKPDAEEQENIKAISSLFQNDSVPVQGFTTRVVDADQKPSSPIAVAPVAIPTQNVPQENLTKPFVPSPSVISHPQEVLSASGNTIISAQPASLDSANVIKGVVKDPRGKLLPHVVVEVLDSNNVPVRAFRTNQTGAFASVTPLPNGTYTIHSEDSLKKQNFEDVSVTLTGSVIPPIEIGSVDQREKLRRELFGASAKIN